MVQAKLSCYEYLGHIPLSFLLDVIINNNNVINDVRCN